MDEQQYNNFNGNSDGTQGLYGNQAQYQQTQFQQTQMNSQMPNQGVNNPYVNQQPYQNYAQNNAAPIMPIPEKYKPIKAWGYFGYGLLFAIPFIGLIFNLVFCFSDKNINRRNYARSVWCGVLIGIIIGVIFGVLMAVLGLSADDVFQQMYNI